MVEERHRHGSLPALLDVRLDEVLRVRLQAPRRSRRGDRRVRPSASRRVSVTAGAASTTLVGALGWCSTCVLLLVRSAIRCVNLLRSGVLPETIEQFAGRVALVDQRSNVFGGPAQWFHHRNPPQRVATDVEHQRVPVGGDDVVRELLQTPPTEVRPCASSAAWSSRRVASSGSTIVSSPARSARHRSGRRSWYCRSIALSVGEPGSNAVTIGVPVDESPLGDPVDLVGDRVGIASRARSGPAPIGRARRRRRASPTAATTRATARTCGPARAVPTGSRTPSPGDRRRA